MSSSPPPGALPIPAREAVQAATNPTGASSQRVPVPLHQWAHRRGAPPATAAPQALLERVRVEPHVLEDFRPLAQCLEWELSDLFWSLSGVLPFAEGEVPFIVNNSGLLSESAAVLLYACCQEAQLADGPIPVLELGAGTGLFARFFLDAFRTLCDQEGRDYYHRLRYVVTDRSAQAVAHWQERGLFDLHPGRVFPGLCSAEEPGRIQSLSGESLSAGAPLAVFCNYVLDVLPVAVVARGPDGAPRQRLVRMPFTSCSGMSFAA